MKKDKSLIELEKKTKMKEALDEMACFVEKAEKKKEELIEKAKKAKRSNDKASYRLACIGLANTIAAKNKAEQMLLSMDVVMTLKDVSKMTSGFLGCMGTLCKEVSTLSKDNNFAKVSKEFSKAMMSFDIQSKGLDTLIEETTANFDNMDMGLGDNIMQEIEAMIDAEAVSDEEELDKSIERKLDKLKNSGKI